jgi:PBP1b-binding outer membrane lipoprotein LpoB
MRRLNWLILLLVLFALISGCGKGKETAPKEGMSHEAKAATTQAAKKPSEMEMEMKGMSMESIQKEGKVQEVAPGTVQISPERQQLIGVKFGMVEMRPLEKVIRTVGRVD